MTKVILSGCSGHMGHVITDCIKNRRDISIVAGVDLITQSYSDYPIYSSFKDVKEDADIVIDFSSPAVLGGLLDFIKAKNIGAVIATTGYNDDQIAAIKTVAKSAPVFFSFNMSLGVNLLIDLAKKSAQILSDAFDIEIVEAHHNQKLDAPSGTAIMIANAINDVSDDVYEYTYNRHDKRAKRSEREIGIHSIRGGTIVGEHQVIFAGRDEIITLSHSARSKEIFAVGAVKAAMFLKDKAPGLYSMTDLINE